MSDSMTNEAKTNLILAILMLLNTFTVYNFSFAIFNMIPIPPFDGSRVLFAFLPDKYYFGIMKYERYIMIALLVFMTAGPGFSIGNIGYDNMLKMIVYQFNWEVVCGAGEIY